MSDYISRADAICEVLVNDGIENIVDRINALPSAELPKGDLISRADAIEAVANYLTPQEINGDKWALKCEEEEAKEVAESILSALPSADAVQGYAEWLEKIIVDAETLEWLCEDTPCKEWCDENCHYSSIQAECLRHLYEVSKGGDDE